MAQDAHSTDKKDLIPCVGCGAAFPATDGPTHRYMESSPGCWAAYGEVLAREYSDLRYASAHRLTVDAYAVQHPGEPSPQTIQSVTLHLISLCLVLERDFDMNEATKAMQQAAKMKPQFTWLDPPPSRGAMTVADVQEASDPQEHVRRAQAWAASAWAAWAPHHGTVQAVIAEMWSQ